MNKKQDNRIEQQTIHKTDNNIYKSKFLYIVNKNDFLASKNMSKLYFKYADKQRNSWLHSRKKYEKFYEQLKNYNCPWIK